MNTSYTFNTVNNPHPEIASIEKVIESHIGWAVNNKDIVTLFSTIVENEELFFFQTDSESTIHGIDEFKSLVDGIFMSEEFKAIRTEIHNLRIHLSPSMKTAWFSCIMDDYNEFKGEPAVWKDVRWTGVLEKIDGHWSIFQMHFSKAEDKVR